jgi:L-threonylcarbamoyladenylate synthase
MIGMLQRYTLESDAAAIAARLQAGSVLALPTETLYGFSCVARSQAGLARIAALKGIGAPRAFLVLVDSLARLEPFLATDLDARTRAFLRATWPAPLTAVLPTRARHAWGDERDGRPTAAFRVPAHGALCDLLARVGEPVVSTSVNRTGQTPLADAAAIEREFGAGLDALIVGAAAAEATGRPSTLADCTAWPPRVLRAGRFELGSAVAAWTAAGPGSDAA